MPMPVCLVCGEAHWRDRPCPKRPRELTNGWECRPDDPEDERVAQYEETTGPRIREETAQRRSLQEQMDAARATTQDEERRAQSFARLERSIEFLNRMYREGKR